METQDAAVLGLRGIGVDTNTIQGKGPDHPCIAKKLSRFWRPDRAALVAAETPGWTDVCPYQYTATWASDRPSRYSLCETITEPY